MVSGLFGCELIAFFFFRSLPWWTIYLNVSQHLNSTGLLIFTWYVHVWIYLSFLIIILMKRLLSSEIYNIMHIVLCWSSMNSLVFHEHGDVFKSLLAVTPVSLKAFLQSHLHGRSPVSICRWLFVCEICLKHFWQSGQLKGFSPLWVRRWAVRLPARVKV